jgi:hypothetical protein
MVLTAGHQKGQRAIGQAESGGREGASVSGAGASGSVCINTRLRLVRLLDLAHLKELIKLK